MSAELTFTMPLTPGEYELRFFMNSYDLLATSPVVTVKPPTLTVSATTVAPGGSVQVSVAEGPGQRGDWVALAAVGSGLASYVDWNYLSGARSMPATGVTSAVLTFDMPETGAYELPETGAYEFVSDEWRATWIGTISAELARCRPQE